MNTEQLTAISTIISEWEGGADIYRDCDIVARGEQKFAVSGGCAYEFLRFETAGEEDGSTIFEYVPAIIDGRAIVIEPTVEGGKSGIVYVMRCIRRRGVDQVGNWIGTVLSQGWLWTSELSLTNREINNSIMDEIDSGALVIRA